VSDSLFILRRYEDVSDVSGTGVVCSGVEFEDGEVAVHWPGQTPSTVIWRDIRHVEEVHGHGGKSVIEYQDPHRLLAAWEAVGPLLLRREMGIPSSAGRHPDHPDRLRVTFRSPGRWDRWIRELGGSRDSAVYEEVNGETECRWVSPDGNLWLIYYSPAKPDSIYDPRD
jgi:hypothetical protein